MTLYQEILLILIVTPPLGLFGQWAGMTLMSFII
jgi:hypothetical protein